jgi:hypothetical protein
MHSTYEYINPLNAKLNPICHLLALLEAHHMLHVSRIRVKIDIDFVFHFSIRNDNAADKIYKPVH